MEQLRELQRRKDEVEREHRLVNRQLNALARQHRPDFFENLAPNEEEDDDNRPQTFGFRLPIKTVEDLGWHGTTYKELTELGVRLDEVSQLGITLEQLHEIGLTPESRAEMR